MRDPDFIGIPVQRDRLRINASENVEQDMTVIFEVFNMVVLLFSHIQRVLDLRVDEAQVYLIIALVSIQGMLEEGFVRKISQDEPGIPWGHTRAVSRRRIAESLCLPAETVRRVVNSLIERGVVVEVSRGQLLASSDILEGTFNRDVRERAAGSFCKVGNLLITKNIVHIAKKI